MQWPKCKTHFSYAEPVPNIVKMINTNVELLFIFKDQYFIVA